MELGAGAQFVRFVFQHRYYLLSLNNIKSDEKELKMLTKGSYALFISQEALMKTFDTVRGPGDVKEFVSSPRPVTAFKEVTPMEIQPTFTLTFSIGTTMREIHDTVIRTVLQYTRSNRLRAAQLLQINPRTIRRRLGKKDGAVATTRAA
jgi:DNA-binding NtrC family response regulator